MKYQLGGKEKTNKYMYTNFDEMPVMLSVKQAADVLGISDVSLYKLIKRDDSFPVLEIGRRKTVPKIELREWIRKSVLK